MVMTLKLNFHKEQDSPNNRNLPLYYISQGRSQGKMISEANKWRAKRGTAKLLINIHEICKLCISCCRNIVNMTGYTCVTEKTA